MADTASPVTKINEFRLTRRVQFHETDAAGIVHFSNYLRYMEEAECALWRAAGLSMTPKAEHVWPRVAVSCEYHSPLVFEDEFEVRIQIAALTDRSIRYAGVMTRGEVLVATLTMTAVCVANSTGNAVMLPAVVRERFEVSPDVAA